MLAGPKPKRGAQIVLGRGGGQPGQGAVVIGVVVAVVGSIVTGSSGGGGAAFIVGADAVGEVGFSGSFDAERSFLGLLQSGFSQLSCWCTH